ncbi:MAG: hypothetical protein ACOH1T_03285 [Microbacteriaceae bacterium]
MAQPQLISRLPWYAKVLIIFAASRLATTAIMLSFAARQGANAWSGTRPDYLQFAGFWDAHWYYIIAVSGYPTVLPLTEAGDVAENAWAFMPAYPFLTRFFMVLTGLDFAVVSVALSVAFAAGAALVFYRLLTRFLPEGSALFAVLLFCVAPLSPILQVGYAESMHAFFLALALLLLVRRDYWLLMPVVAVMSLTRPSGLAFALALLLHVIHRWFTRNTDPFAWRERVASVISGLFSAFMGIAWLLIAAAVTGSLTAYTDTELAWREDYVGRVELIPFTPWVQSAGFWLGMPAGPFIVAAAIAFLLAVAALLLSPWGRRIGVDLRLWVVSYLLYLLAVFFPQSSTFRLLVPIFPVLGALAVPTSRVYRTSIVVLCLAAQYGWIHIAWWVDGYDWTPP